MKKDAEKTKVQFLVNGKDLFAFFPDDYAAPFGTYRTAYSHIGQHSACALEYAAQSRPASPAEYADLKSELESIGYNLEVIN